MAQLTTSQLIKIILGIFVVVIVIAGVFLFFKDNVIDFIDNLTGGEKEETQEEAVEETEEQEEEEEPEISCGDCGEKFLQRCKRETCENLNQELNAFNRGCEYIRPGIIKFGKCVPVNLG